MRCYLSLSLPLHLKSSLVVVLDTTGPALRRNNFSSVLLRQTFLSKFNFNLNGPYIQYIDIKN